jgi:carbon-monoxide dehydrogenase iron sulfur subunit
MSGKGQVWIKREYENCSGCRRCTIACSLHHEGKIWPEASRVRVFMFVPGIEIPHLCFQCEDYPCVESCPADALSVDSRTGAVVVNISNCTACGQCIEACPGKVPHLHPEGNHIVICDLCDGDPECVKACQKGRWKALALTPKAKSGPRKSQSKTPHELTRQVAERIVAKETAEEVLGQ